jgi:hypothetical protein
MRSLKTLIDALKSIALDFIIKLLPSKKVLIKIIYDLILIIINRLTKYVYFISYKKDLGER